jgi:hypothetical protein
MIKKLAVFPNLPYARDLVWTPPKERQLFVIVAGLCLGTMAYGNIFVSIDSIGYVGSWEKFATLSDAQNDINPVNSGVIPQRDLQMYLSEGRTSPDGFQIVTGWNLGSGNPSNTNEGFLQISDIGFASRDSMSAGWTDANFDTYKVSLSGSNAMPRLSPSNTNQETRLGVGPDDRSTNGTWLSYGLDITFDNLTSTEDQPGVQQAEDDPSNVFGSLFVLFENPNDLDLDGNPNANKGFYRANIDINMTSWAVDNGVTEVVNDPSEFEASTTPVPEPASYPLIVAALTGLWMLARRRL